MAKEKIFGVLVAESQQRQLSLLAAYSGQIESKSDWSGLIPAVFDYLQPQGYLKKHEEQVAHINALAEQEGTGAGCLVVKQRLKRLGEEAQQTLATLQNHIEETKQEHDHPREISSLSIERKAKLIRRS